MTAKSFSRQTARTLGAPLTATVIAIAASLLLGGVARGAASEGQPTNRKEALAFIKQTSARAEAEKLAAIEETLTPLEREWGIKVLGLRVTAAGYVLDFRYKVLDPKKAAPIVQRQFSPTPYVLVERNGAKLGVPFTDKAGSLRSSVTNEAQIKRGRNYTALFANPGRHVKPGEKVTVVFGDFKAEHMTVQ
jgi:hypothetical protein